MKRSTLLVTGSSGRLGSAVARLLSPHHDLVLFDSLSPRDPALRALGRVIVGSITDRAAVARACDGVDAIVHCAAFPGLRAPYDELLALNVGGTVNLLEEAGSRNEIKQFIFISSICYHGVLEQLSEEFMPRFLPFDETHPSLSVNYYGGGKMQAEHWCRMYVKRFKKPVVALRPAFILSLEQEPQFKPQPAPDYPCLLDYVAASDVVEAIRLALEYHPQDGFDRFIVNAPDQRSTTPTLELLDRHFPGIPADREKLAAEEGFAAFLDCSHARETLGWEPKFRLR